MTRKKSFTFTLSEHFIDDLDEVTRQRQLAVLQSKEKLDARSASRSRLVEESIVDFLAKNGVFRESSPDVTQEGYQVILLPMPTLVESRLDSLMLHMHKERMEVNGVEDPRDVKLPTYKEAALYAIRAGLDALFPGEDEEDGNEEASEAP